MRNVYVETALDLREQGITTIPIAADKKPPEGVRWKRYQRRPPTPDEIGIMFGRPGITGLAILCGEASGGVCVRDWDEPGSFDRWEDANPYLAGMLPKVRARRGPHGYFRTSRPTRTVVFGDGELRGTGGYALLPPSLHPEGGEYLWLNGEPPDFSELPVVDPAFFGARKLQESENANAAAADIPPWIPPNTLCDNSGPWSACLPTGPHQRHNCIFALVQRLKFLRENRGRSPEHLQANFRHWFELALPFIRTRSWTANWRDFSEIWRDIRCAGSLEMAAVRASRLPKMVAGKPRVDAVCRLCKALADMTSGEFFLSCRDAGAFAGVSDAQQGRRLLASLERMGFIVLLKRGTQGTRGVANVWRWTGGNQK